MEKDGLRKVEFAGDCLLSSLSKSGAFWDIDNGEWISEVSLGGEHIHCYKLV